MIRCIECEAYIDDEGEYMNEVSLNVMPREIELAQELEQLKTLHRNSIDNMNAVIEELKTKLVEARNGLNSSDTRVISPELAGELVQLREANVALEADNKKLNETIKSCNPVALRTEISVLNSIIERFINKMVVRHDY